jgi:hypothetical protein
MMMKCRRESLCLEVVQLKFKGIVCFHKLAKGISILLMIFRNRVVTKIQQALT